MGTWKASSNVDPNRRSYVTYSGFSLHSDKYAWTLYHSADRTELLPPANEVWGKGNVFTGVYLSTRGGGGGWLPSMHHRSHDQGDLHPDAPPSPEIHGILRDRSTSERYASYWNAFLYKHDFPYYSVVTFFLNMDSGFPLFRTDKIPYFHDFPGFF